jgi:hypothetical protein
MCSPAYAAHVWHMSAERRKAASKSVADSSTSRFLTSLETRVSDPVHRRLLKAARKANPASALESELRAILDETLNEA